LREALIAAARGDRRISGVALVGSAASGQEDALSDLDLALGVHERDPCAPAGLRLEHGLGRPDRTYERELRVGAIVYHRIEGRTS
jgi:predicted nucleotidyltransferase